MFFHACTAVRVETYHTYKWVSMIDISEPYLVYSLFQYHNHRNVSNGHTNCGLKVKYYSEKPSIFHMG